MRGNVAAMRELNAVARRHNSILYIDDAHAPASWATRVAVLCSKRWGATTIRSSSVPVKACSVFGAFVACTRDFQRLLKMKSNTFIFGGPVPPPYLEAISTVIDILTSDAYYPCGQNWMQTSRHGQRPECLDLIVLGGHSPIISVLVGHEEQAFQAANSCFDRGFYVQSVAFPAVLSGRQCCEFRSLQSSARGHRWPAGRDGRPQGVHFLAVAEEITLRSKAYPV